jgi:hypothetical protein
MDPQGTSRDLHIREHLARGPRIHAQLPAPRLGPRIGPWARDHSGQREDRCREPGWFAPQLVRGGFAPETSGIRTTLAARGRIGDIESTLGDSG